jgi:hypothetical protein
MKNYIGLAFMQNYDMMTTLSFALVLQIPNMAALAQREMTNEMYSATAYTWAVLFSSMSTYMIHPLIVCLGCFWTVDVRDSSATNFFYILLIYYLQGFVGLTLGMFLGSFIKKDNIALMTLVAVLIFFGLGGGVFVTVGPGSNYIV